MAAYCACCWTACNKRRHPFQPHACKQAGGLPARGGNEQSACQRSLSWPPLAVQIWGTAWCKGASYQICCCLPMCQTHAVDKQLHGQAEAMDMGTLPTGAEAGPRAAQATRAWPRAS